MKKAVSLKVLASISVEEPCHESWEKMTGDQKQRFCDRCQHSVNNISEMTREEAAAIVTKLSGTGRLCVRYRVGNDGAIQFKSSGRATKTVWQHAAAIVLGILALTRFSSSARAEDTIQGDISVPTQERIKMGEMLAVTPQATPVATAAATPSIPCHTMGKIAPPVKQQASRQDEVVGQMVPPKEN